MLARSIAGDHANDEILQLARDAVRAHFDLLRVREVKRDLMERMHALGTVNPLQRFRSISAEIKYVLRQPVLQPLSLPEPINPLGPMPSGEDERAAEAWRRLLPERRKLDRYERRAFLAKLRASRKLADRREALGRSTREAAHARL